MIPMLAKNAVRLKCNFTEAGMTGNYECAYALGIVCACLGQPEVDIIEVFPSFKESVMALTDGFNSDDDKMKRLIEMLNEYEAGEVNDEQILELYHMGYSDGKI